MASFPLYLSTACRHAIALAAALTMIPPVYAVAYSCHSSDDSCPHCAAIAGENESSRLRNSGCCHDERQSSEHAVASQSVAGNDFSSCACSTLPIHQPTPSATRNVPNSLDLVVLSNSASFDAVCPELTSFNTADWLSNLSLAMPHRILHCSWLI
jgi:hypothetical protein